MNYKSFDLEENFQDTYFGHVFKKTYACVITNGKMCQIFKYELIKSTQIRFVKMYDLAYKV